MKKAAKRISISTVYRSVMFWNSALEKILTHARNGEIRIRKETIFGRPGLLVNNRTLITEKNPKYKPAHKDDCPFLNTLPRKIPNAEKTNAVRITAGNTESAN
jgi:hypothetical protein